MRIEFRRILNLSELLIFESSLRTVPSFVWKSEIYSEVYVDVLLCHKTKREWSRIMLAVSIA